MSRPDANRAGRRGIDRSGLAPLATLLGLFAAVAFAVPAPLAAQSQDGLLEALEERYEAIPTRDGLLFRPRGEAEFAAIEVVEDEVFVDGVKIDDEELSRLVGPEDAERFQRFADLESEERAAAVAPEEPRAGPVSDVDDTESLEERIRRRVDAELERAEEEIAAEAEEIAGEAEERAREVEERAREAQERARQIERRVHRRTGDARVVFGSSVHVHEDEIIEDVVAIGGSVTVDGEVLGDVVAVGGSVRARGHVSGDVVAVGGSVRLGDRSRVGGEVVSVGGGVHRDPGAEVDGPITEVDFWNAFALGDWDRGENAVFDLIGSLVFALVVFLIGALALLVARGSMEKVSRQIGISPWQAGALGFGSLVFFFPVVLVIVILLCISIIGIPLLLLVPFGILAFFLACFFGYLACAYRLGRWGEARFEWNLSGTVVALLLGIVFLHGWTITARLLDVVDTGRDFAGFVVLLLLFCGFTVMVTATCVGLGGVLLAMVNGRRTPPTTAAAPPQAPSVPPSTSRSEVEPPPSEPVPEEERGTGEEEDRY